PLFPSPPPGPPPPRPPFPTRRSSDLAMPEYAPLVERMEQAAALTRGNLSRAAVDALYGSRVPMSASRMDKFKSCHFSIREADMGDRKSTRLNSSHVSISYAVFCLKKK